QTQAQHDLETGESIGIPIALIVLVIVFGALLAAGVPLVLGILAIVGAVGLSALVGHISQLSFFITNVITMMGLAVGIDYSLFIVSRYREERAKGLAKEDAIAATGSTASRAVFFSGMTAVRVPFIGKGAVEADHEKHGGFWDRVTRLVMRYPVIALVAAAALLIALAIPYIDIKTGSAGVSTLPDGLRSKEGFQILQSQF